MGEYAQAWRFKHPSPWDYANFMSNALHQDLGWFWYYWLFTTERVDESIQDVRVQGSTASITVRQDGEMPAPVILKIEFAPGGGAPSAPSAARPLTPGSSGTISWLDANTAVVSYPVDVWFGGSRTFVANMNFASSQITRVALEAGIGATRRAGSRVIRKITLDPNERFPDRDASDNIWPRVPTSRPSPTN